MCECAGTYDSQERKPLPVAWRFGSLFSGRNHWNADRGVWIMDCPTVAQRRTHSVPFPQTATPAVVCTTHPLFSTPGRCWRVANHHWVCEWLNMCTCVCVCGNVGSACSPRAMLINALQTKCSPFSLFSLSPPLLPSSAHLSSPLSGHCWERRRRWCWGTGRGAGGKYMNKAEYERKYTIAGFDNAELSRCLPAAFSVWCWERSIYSTESYSSDCLSLVTPYITNQPSPYYRTRAATNTCFHCRLICRLFCELIDWLFLF